MRHQPKSPSTEGSQKQVAKFWTCGDDCEEYEGVCMLSVTP